MGTCTGIIEYNIELICVIDISVSALKVQYNKDYYILSTIF